VVYNGGLGVCVLWSDVMTAFAHAVVCWRRDLGINQISSLANGTFSGLTALTILYGAGLWIWVFFLACFFCVA
jgi:hypothetical protein